MNIFHHFPLYSTTCCYDCNSIVHAALLKNRRAGFASKSEPWMIEQVCKSSFLFNNWFLRLLRSIFISPYGCMANGSSFWIARSTRELQYLFFVLPYFFVCFDLFSKLLHRHWLEKNIMNTKKVRVLNIYRKNKYFQNMLCNNCLEVHDKVIRWSTLMETLQIPMFKVSVSGLKVYLLHHVHVLSLGQL